MPPFAEIGGHHDLAFHRVRKHETRILVPNAHLLQAVVHLAAALHEVHESLVALGVRGHGRGLDEPERLLIHVPLGLLGEGGHAVAHQLMRQTARNAGQTDGGRGVLEHRQVAVSDQHPDEAVR